MLTNAQFVAKKIIMRKKIIFCVAFLLVGMVFISKSGFSGEKQEGSNSLPDKDLKLWFSRPATQWQEALPLGNGRIGAMVFGGVNQERVILNEATLYSGVPHKYDSLPDYTGYLDIISHMIRNGDYADAGEYGDKHITGEASPCFQPLGDLVFQFPGSGDCSDYLRELDLSKALSSVRYAQNGTNFSREVFISHPDNAMIIRMKSDTKGAISFTMSMESQHPTLQSSPQAKNEFSYTGQVAGFVLRRTLEWVEERNQQWKYPDIWDKEGKRKPGAASILYNGKGIKFEVRIRVLNCDGKISTNDKGLKIEKASEVILAVAIASSFNGYDKNPTTEGIDPSGQTRKVIDQLAKKTYGRIFNSHLTDYQNLFNKASLHLESSEAQMDQPTDIRKLNHANAPDPSLEALFFQYGRYLLISSSRVGGQPVNLQGLWNVDVVPPWGSNYTTNINTQMNYWLAETTNLAECHEPLFRFLEEISVTGGKVASQMYQRPGWVLHHTTSLWRGAHPVDINAPTSFWPMAGGWFCQHLWEHYQFTLDREFLKNTAYPLMKGAASFYNAWLVPNEQGYLVTPVSTSPENQFLYVNKHGQTLSGGMSEGSTLDMAVIRELFKNTVDAGKLLNADAEFCAKLEANLPKLLPYQVGSNGQLLEFSKEFIEGPPRHNTSPYYPLYPGTQFTLRKTPALTESLKTLMINRSGSRVNGGGWPGVWYAALWARLHEGDKSLSYLKGVLGRTFMNLFSGSGTTFQIDANLGYTASVVEMLLQSHDGEIEMLPALPKTWESGSVKGFRARGGYEVSMNWQNGNLIGASVKSISDGVVKLRLGTKTAAYTLRKGELISLDKDLQIK
jgi:alpha-L-fucosidase 2